MTKLLQINTVVNYGSTGRITSQIGDLAIKKGYESYIAFGRKNGKSNSTLLKIESKIGNYFHVVRTRLTDRHGLGSANATKRLIAKIKELSPDIIHLHNIHGYYLNYELLFEYLNISKTPIVWTLHDCWSFTGHCAYFDFIGCKKWETGCYSCPQLKTYPKSYLDNSDKNYALKKKVFNLNENLTLVPVSGWLQSLITKSILKNHNSKVIHNGVNTQIFKPHPPDKTFDNKFGIENKFVILGVASIWEPRKGLKDFIELGKLIDDDCRIILVGLNINQLKDLPKKVIGLSRTDSQKDLVQLYSRADIFFNPTYEDNFPTTNLEAMACGTPVISYNTGGSPEPLTSETGFVVVKGDLTSALGKINFLKKNYPKLISDKCVDNVRTNFEMNNQFEKYFQLYDEILTPKNKF